MSGPESFKPAAQAGEYFVCYGARVLSQLTGAYFVFAVPADNCGDTASVRVGDIRYICKGLIHANPSGYRRVVSPDKYTPYAV